MLIKINITDDGELTTYINPHHIIKININETIYDDAQSFRALIVLSEDKEVSKYLKTKEEAVKFVDDLQDTIFRFERIKHVN